MLKGELKTLSHIFTIVFALALISNFILGVFWWGWLAVLAVINLVGGILKRRKVLYVVLDAATLLVVLAILMRGGGSLIKAEDIMNFISNVSSIWSG